MSVQAEVICRRPPFEIPPVPEDVPSDQRPQWVEAERAKADKARDQWSVKHRACEDRAFRPGETVVIDEADAEAFRKAHPAVGAEWTEERDQPSGEEHGAKCDRCDDGDVVEGGRPKVRRCAHCGRPLEEVA